ncbi:MAG: hypothetical protein H6709_13760 [Kofleriaceae bacterium]|nr:hypothetical protein [Kofleriaceae bacterium]
MAMGVDEYGKGGLFGKDEWGKERSAFDWASDKGHSVSGLLGGGTLGDVGGIATTAALSVPAAFAGVGQTAANAVDALWHWSD